MEQYQYQFEKLNAWIEAKNLVKMVYAVLSTFPMEERFALCAQLRRAVISIPSNIAEGTSRLSDKDKAHFMEIAYGSLMEVYCQLKIAQELDYLTVEQFNPLRDKIFIVGRLLSGLRGSFNKQ